MSFPALLLLSLLGAQTVPLPAAVPPGKAAAAEYYEQIGHGLASWGRTEAALACYRKSLERQPERPTAHLGLAEQLIRLGRAAEALREVDGVLAAEPRNAMANRLRGYLALQAREPKQAERILLEHLARRPEDAEAQILLAQTLIAQKRVEDAELCLRDAIRADAARPDAHLLLAQVLMEEKHLAAATAALRRHLRLYPDNAQAIGMMTELLAGQRRLAEAADWGRKLVALRPDDPRAWGLLVACYEQLHKPDEAAKACAKVAELATDPPMILQACEFLSRYHVGRQEWSAAARYLKRIVSLKPVLLPPRMQLADCYRQAGDMLSAAATLRGLISLQPRDFELRRQHIALLLEAGEMGLARVAVERAAADFPREQVIGSFVGELLRRGQGGLAVGLLQDLRRRYPARHEYTVMLADVWLATRQPERAKALFAELMRALPQDGQLRLRVAQFEQADFAWDKVIALLEPMYNPAAPGEAPPPLLQMLATAYDRTGRARKAAGCYEQLSRAAHEPLLLLRAARQCARIQDYERAVALCREAVAAEPKHVPSRLELAALYAATEQWDRATGELEEVLRLAPKHPAALHDLVEIERARGDLPAAAERCAALAEVLPGSEQVIAELGDIAWQRSRHAEALEIWRKGLEAVPASPALHDRLARAMEEDAYRDEALTEYAAAARAASCDLASRLALVRLYDAAGQHSEARRWARDIIDLSPALPTGYRLWLETFLAEGQPPLAVDAGVALLQTGSTRRALVGPLVQAAGEHDLADDLQTRLETMLSLGAARPAARDARAAGLAAAGLIDQAIIEYEALAAAEPGQSLWPRRIGDLRRAAGDLPAAADAYHRALVAQPRDIEALETLAAVRLEQGDATSAGEALARMAALRPASPLALARTVRLAADKGHAAAMRAALDAVLRRPDGQPPEVVYLDNPALMCALGLAHELLGDLRSAMAAYNEAAGCAPSMPEAQEARRRVAERLQRGEQPPSRLSPPPAALER